MRRLSILLGATALSGCVATTEPKPHPIEEARAVVASVYWQPQRVACGGGRFDPNGMTFAHKSLHCGTRARFTAANGRTVVATVTDRGPYIRGREVDLSDGAARAIGLGRSVHLVSMEVMR